MMPNTFQPTPYPDVNAMLHTLLTNAQTVLGDNLLGMYLDGSLALGDFDSQSSDIDFVVVTSDELATETLAALTALHDQIAASSSAWSKNLEGSYLPQAALRRYDPNNTLHPRIVRGTGSDESRLLMTQHDSDWVVHRHVLREHGVVITGPAPHTLIDPIHPDDLRRAMANVAQHWYTPFLLDPVLLHHDGYHDYTIVTLCRMLYTLRYGTVVSKLQAARWAQVADGKPWAALIERALGWAIRWEDVNETLALMHYTVDRCTRWKPRTEQA